MATNRELGRPPICPWRFSMAKALAAAFAGKSGNVPSNNISARAHDIVLLADALVSKLEQLEAGTLPEKHIPDTYHAFVEIE